jgi:hypothetical protein
MFLNFFINCLEGFLFAVILFDCDDWWFQSLISVLTNDAIPNTYIGLK